MEGKATDEKELGNLAFKEQRFDDAVAHYTAALASSPPDAVHLVLSNRAAALLALSKFEDALRDCEEVVKRSSGFLKGYLRMAQGSRPPARSGLTPRGDTSAKGPRPHARGPRRLQAGLGRRSRRRPGREKASRLPGNHAARARAQHGVGAASRSGGARGL